MKEYIVLYENKYAVIPEDYNKEKLKNFPIEVVAQMAIETMKQDNIFNIEIFQKNKCANKDERGFSWYTSGKSHYAFPNKASLWIKIIEEPNKNLNIIKDFGEVNNNTFFESGIIYELPDKNFFISIEDLKEIKSGITDIWNILYLYYKYDIQVTIENIKNHVDILSKLDISYEDKTCINSILEIKSNIENIYDNIIYGKVNKKAESFILKKTSEEKNNTFIKEIIITNNLPEIIENNKIIKDYVYKEHIGVKTNRIYLTEKEIEESIKCDRSPLLTLIHKYNIIKQGKLFFISDIKYGFISYLKSISKEEKDILCKLKACSKNNYFNIGYKFFTLKDEVLIVKNIIIKKFKDTNYNIYIKFDNEVVINSNKIEEYLYYTNKWYKEKIIKDSDYKISADIYEKFYEYPISVVISFINSLWLSNTDKRDNFNFFVLNNTIKDLIEYYCYNKTFFRNIMLKNDYEAYYINAGKQILEEDLMYFKNVMRHNYEYELPEYFKSKYNKDNKTGKELWEEKLISIEKLNDPKCIKGIEYKLIYLQNNFEVTLTEIEKNLCIKNNVNPYVALLYKANYYRCNKLLWLSNYVLREVTEVLNIKNSIEGEYFWNKVIKNKGILGESRSIIYSLGKDDFKLRDIILYITSNIKSGDFSIHYKYIGNTNEYYLIEDYKDFKKEEFKIINNTINSKEDGRQEFKSKGNEKDGRSENQLQGENTVKSCYRFTERSKLFGGRYRSSITDENAFSKERTSKNKSVLRKY